MAAEPDRRTALLQDYLHAQVAWILVLDDDEVDPQQPLNTLGLDSIMALELKNMVETDLAIVLSMSDLMRGPTLAQLAAQLVPQLLAPDRTAVASQAWELQAEVSGVEDPDELLRMLDELPEDQVDALLRHYNEEKKE
ncbi:MAG: Beta-ketoacyl synthase [Firmicutes bacterium]|nr:Beta-ketoacyl synthase [Bacillota bacterium]